MGIDGKGEEMNIKPDDLVLEVGSGDKPYLRSDVLLDKLPEDSSERDGGKSLVVDRPLVIGNAEALPFPNKSFDYIIASHVLEHARNPAKFLDEISRVGKRGYIETPLPLREWVYDWPFHRWYVSSKGATLILIRKTEKSKKFLGGKRRDFYFLGGTKLINCHHEWKGRIRYKIFPEEPDGFLEGLDQKSIKLKESELHSVADLAVLSKWLKDNLFKVKLEFEKRLKERERKKDINIFSLIVCPGCQGKLLLRKDGLACRSCGRSFWFYREKIPILLI